ncbi:ImpA family metalloprotease [Vibrio sp. NH-7]
MSKKQTYTGLAFTLSFFLMGCGGGGGSDSPAKEMLTEVERALISGNALAVKDANAFISYNRTWVESHKKVFDQVKKSINGETSGLFWDPTHDAAILSPTYGFNDTILMTNKAMQDGYTDQTLSIGVAGVEPSRYAVLASNPFRTSKRFPSSVNDQMAQWMDNLLVWLNGAPFAGETKVVIAQMDQSYYFPDETATREWLDARYGNRLKYNDANTCDGASLLACVEAKPNLLILSQHLEQADELKSVEQAVARAKQLNIPILYLHWDGGMTALGQSLFREFRVNYVGDNYWRKLGVSDWNGNELLNTVPEHIEWQQTLLKRLEDDSFTVDLTLCDDKSCPDEANMATEFYSAAQSIRNQLGLLDEQGIRLFDSKGYEYEKSIVLLADHYRQDVQFPMDKSTTERINFLRSYFADYVQYNSRDINPAQPDMGNFSRSEFDDQVERVTHTVNLESKRNFRAAGVYALPGETFTVTRNDRSPVTTKIVVNTLRSGATHEFSKNGYSRPKLLTSHAYTVQPGETIRLTSSYGGPVQVHFDTNNQPVELTFQGVARHPVWRSSADNESFVTQLNAGQFDWAELITPGFEVHSKTDKMMESIGAEDWAQPADMALATERYVHNLPHTLAGFQGPGIDKIADIHQYAETKGWQIETIDIVKHMNADQATCGYGCSGNPYDAYWSFHPLGHGDLHELGHGLEKGRFRFAGWEGHSTTNYYSYYSKSRYLAETGRESTCQNLDFAGQYQLLQQSRLNPDPNAFMAAQNQTGWSWGARVVIQIMMQAENQGVVNNGWHLLGRLHILEREFNRLKSDDELWLASRANIGFASYSRDEANAISNNDWLLIAFSTITSRDMRQYLDMWGFSFSDKAKQEVIAKSLQSMPLSYFATSGTGYCRDEFAKTEIPVDGTTVWPL